MVDVDHADTSSIDKCSCALDAGLKRAISNERDIV
jgi:hypothetical protein